MALHIILGLSDSGPHAEVDCLYCGRDAEAATAARDKAKHAITKWVRNPSGQRRVNPKLAAEMDAESAKLRAKAEKEAAKPKPDEVTILRKQLKETKKELKTLASVSKAVQEKEDRIAELEAQLSEKNSSPDEAEDTVTDTVDPDVSGESTDKD